ncbi:MAG TPA: Ig-like domain-containing protein [Chitinophagaceae bacterium]|nr:Ig-like domain-containing protein [Chitinophagaceae bacterium]
MVSPTGGPKDETSPLLKKRSLADSAINFKGGKIEFEFNEFIQIKDIQNQLVITPLLKTNPKVSVHKRTLTVNIDDSLLEKNTTYSISLGNAVQDLREGNIYDNLYFTFSTGKTNQFAGALA